MAKSEELLAQIIEDAQNVAAYGQETGRLKDIELISAIAAAEKLPHPAWSDTAIVGLQAALNRAVMDIAPVTLGDLRDGWKPYQRKKWYLYWPQLTFVLFALLLLTLTSCATLDFNRGSALIGEISELANRTPQGDINLAIRRLIKPDSNAENYADTVGRLREIDNNYRFYGTRSSSYIFAHSQQPYVVVGTWMRDRTFDIFGVRASVEVSMDLPQAGNACSPGASPSPQPEQSSSTPSSDTSQSSLPSSSTPTTPAGTPAEQQSDSNVRKEELAALCKEQLSTALLDGTTFGPIIYSIRFWIDPWGAIYLPALYGALGATIYYIRRFLDPAVRDPSLMGLTVRIASGAFAGVVITWFWTPNNQLLSSFSSAGLTIFTIAFLVGFGVEVLFVLLDRLVNGAMAVAKGAEPRPGLIVPFYVSAPPPASDTQPQDKKPDNPTDDKDQKQVDAPETVFGPPAPTQV